MAIELLLILCLIGVLVFSVTVNLNMGLVALAVAYIVGVYVVDVPLSEIAAGFPTNMFFILLGVLFLLGVAQENKTMDWVVARCIGMVGGRLAALPLLFFAIACITSTLPGPSAAPLLVGIAINLACRFGFSPLLAGVMVCHGSQGGGYSPLAPYGVLVGELVKSSGLEFSPWALYFGVLGSHILLAVIIYFLFGGYKLIGQRVDKKVALDQVEHLSITAPQIATLIGFAVLFLAALVFDAHIGLAAVAISLVLLLFLPRSDRQKTLTRLPWAVIVVVSGILTLVNLMQHVGAVAWLGDVVNQMASPVFIALMLCFIVAVVTGMASTFGTIGMLIPLSLPFLVSGEISVMGTVIALAVSAAVTDVSPFSALGALMVASAPEGIRDRLMRQALQYVICLAVLVPIIVWLVFIVSGSL